MENTKDDIFNRFVGLGAEVISEQCTYKKPHDCYCNCKQGSLTYKDTLVTILYNRDGLHVTFGELPEDPPDACELWQAELLIVIMEKGL